MAQVTLANPLPWWAILLVLAGLAAIAWLAYSRLAVAPRRRAGLAFVRFVILSLLLLFLLRPIRSTDDGLHDAVVPILVDGSRSMAIDDAGGRRRIDRARDLVEHTLVPAIAPHFRTEVLSVGDALKAAAPADLNATGRTSDLAGALAAVVERYRGRPVAGVVLVSDGGDTGVTPLPERTPSVYAVGVGSPSIGLDREVVSVTAADAVFDDSRVDLAVSAVAHGQQTEPLALQLLENGRPIEVRRVAPAADGVPVRTVFRVAPARGQPVVYTVEVPVAPGERVPENNSRSVLVQTSVRVRHVLFLEGAPGFEHSFLQRAWAADPGLDVDAVVRKGRNEQGADTFYIQASRSRSGALTSGYPARVEDLFAYDALVLANLESRQLTREQQEMTRAFVGLRGGGILVLGARSFAQPGLAGTPLEEVLPLELSDRGDAVLPASTRGINRVTLTAAGESHPVMQLGNDPEQVRKRWDATPALASAFPLGGPKPGASVLAAIGGAGGTARALVAVQRYGEGRAMIFTGEGAWRWRMLLPSTDRSYDTFWRQAVRWLALRSTEPIAIVPPPAGGSPGDTLPVRIAVRTAAFVAQTDATVDLRVTAPDGRTQTVRAFADPNDPDGGYVARITPASPGVFRLSAEARRGTATLGTASTSMLVGGADLEMADPRLNTALLQRVALASGGQLVDDADAASIVDRLRAGLPAARLAVTHDLWHNAWAFAAIVSLLAAEWVLRRRWGLR